MTQFGETFGTAPFGGSGVAAAVAPDAPAARWSAVVTLAAVDVSARVTGDITVEAEASTARLATFTIRPSSGTIDPRDWIGAAVQIDYKPDGEAAQRLFTGKVVDPDYDLDTGQCTFRCSDGLQELMEGKTEAQLLALFNNASLTGRYSEAVFGPREDGWRQAEDILSTVPADYDLNRDGSTGVFAPWELGSATYVFDDTSARFVSLELGRRRDIVNRININAKYRYSREHHREVQFNWNWDGLCDWIVNPYELPTRDMIAEAAAGINWINKGGGICHNTLPENGTYCSGTGLSVSDEQRQIVVISATWRAARRWAQLVTEDYQITVQESGSVTGYGVLIGEDSGGLAIDNDNATWNSSLETDAPAAATGGDLAGYQVADCGYSMLATGESWAWTDKGDATARENFLWSLVQLASTRIEASHRQNYVTFQTWIMPDIERSMTLELDAGGVECTGRVKQVRHVLSDGSALTTIKLALRQVPAGGTATGISLPTAPNSTSGYSNPAVFVDLDTRIGFEAGAASYDEDWTGFTSNRSSYAGTYTADQIYPVRFRVDGPDIEDAAVDEIEADGSETQEIKIDSDPLEITA